MSNGSTVENIAAAEAQLLGAMKAGGIPKVEDFKHLIERLAHHHILARVFLLDGTPHVFINSPMKYIIFKEQVASELGIGSQDVCIVGSARLGFSPSAHKFGRPFSETSDVDVVLISEPLFLEGSQALFQELNTAGPRLSFSESPHAAKPVQVEAVVWKDVKEAIRNFVFNNFNPGLLSGGHPLQVRIFNGISGTTGLFLALEPQAFFPEYAAEFFERGKPLRITTHIRCGRPSRPSVASRSSLSTRKRTPFRVRKLGHRPALPAAPRPWRQDKMTKGGGWPTPRPAGANQRGWRWAGWQGNTA
jgi:hypothetical protein